MSEGGEPPELSVSVRGRVIPTNAAYAPVAFKLKGSSKWVARIRLTAEGEAWRDEIARQVLAARVRVAPNWRLNGTYELFLVYDFVTPTSDIDGPLKLTLDALEGVGYTNDSHVIHLDVWKRVNRAMPGVEITLRALSQGPPQQGALKL